MSNARWKFGLALVAIFAAGVVTGALLPHAMRYGGWRGGRPMPPRPEEMAAHLQARFKRELSLTAEQEQKVAPLLQESARSLQTIRAEGERKVVESMESVHARIRELLTPEQVVKLEEMQKRRRERMTRGGGGPPPPR